MLVDPTWTRSDISNVLFMIGGGGAKKKVQQGVWLNSNWSAEYEVREKLEKHPEFDREIYGNYYKKDVLVPERLVCDNLYEKEPITLLYCYGVVDSPEQLLELYDFEKDPRKLFISLVEIRREDQDPCGGWRYHKWGEYYGTQNPVHEYLYDDKHINVVYTFHVYQFS